MDKEREPITDGSFSEKQSDLAIDKNLSMDQIKAGNIFVNPKKKKQKTDK